MNHYLGKNPNANPIFKMKYSISLLYFFLSIVFVSIFLHACSTDLGSINDNAIEPTETIKIAVLVPFGAKEKKLSHIGKSLRDAALLAKQDLGSLNLQIIIYDTKGRVDSGLDSAYSAINGGAHLIVGPFLPDVVKAISTVTKSEGIKIVSFASDLELAGNNTFIIGDTPVNRTQKLVKYAVEKEKYRFGIISSIESSNSELEKSIRSMIKRSGGIETFNIHYSGNMNSLSDIAEEVREIAVSTPIDAIIIPGDPNRQIPLLAAELSDITNSTGNGQIQIIGLSRWDLATSLLSEPSLQGSWLAIPDTRFRKIYEEKFIKKFGYRPHLLSSLAYDAIAAMGVLVRKRDVHGTYYPFSTSEILNTNGFIGIDGIFRFKSNRTVEKALAVMEIRNGQPNILKPALNKFD